MCENGIAVRHSNPIAGQGRGKRIANALARNLQRAADDVRVSFDRADRVNPSFLQGNFAACVSIGGDGTLRASFSDWLPRWGSKPFLRWLWFRLALQT